MSKQYKIVKATYPRLIGVIFEYTIINTGDTVKKAPPWFVDFVENKFDPLAKKVDGLETKVHQVEQLLHRVIKLNNLKY